MNKNHVDSDLDLELEETVIDASIDLQEAIRKIRSEGVDFEEDADEPPQIEETIVDHSSSALKEAISKIRRQEAAKKAASAQVKQKQKRPQPDYELEETAIDHNPPGLQEALAKIRKANQSSESVFDHHQDVDLDLNSPLDETMVDYDQKALQEALAAIRRKNAGR